MENPLTAPPGALPSCRMGSLVAMKILPIGLFECVIMDQGASCPVEISGNLIAIHDIVSGRGTLSKCTMCAVACCIITHNTVIALHNCSWHKHAVSVYMCRG